MKECSKCNHPKETSEFGKRKSTKDGLYTWCKLCCKLNSESYRLANDIKVKADRNNWQKNNPSKSRATKTKWNKTHPDKVKEINKIYRTLNKGKCNSHTATRRAKIRKAIPKWLNQDQLKEIAFLYNKAREMTETTSIPHHVDHIIPLQNSVVCGLHVPWNLQVIEKKANLIKGNRI